MGCDIHPHLDRISTHFGKKKAFYVCQPDVGGRNYDLFTALAGVRNYRGVETLESKGMPKEISKAVLNAYTLPVSPAMQPRTLFGEDDEYYCTRELAERWGRRLLERR